MTEYEENEAQSFAMQTTLTGAEKAAILFGELDYKARDSIMQYLKTDEIHLVRKILKKKNRIKITDYTRILPTELKVLEEVGKYGVNHRLSDVSPSLLDAQRYAKLHENDDSKKFLKNLVKNPNAVANVLSVWLKDD
ncbi:MAG: hypothetical protein HDR54_04595 [Treponema sp.]|nr:hypothetical protein [Treponema sp.]MBD5406750.1 hypothetical protein [Treponema sp.]MBD5408657.1 hypothetical protein [Treponema sp.]MBD5413293.1 hypothetical protein [Treponema sp.]MBD5442573.1 hypothetical protein [Treponema sp.]